MRLLTAPEVAAILRVKTARVYEMSRIKILPTVRMGRQVRYDEDALREWIRAGGLGSSEAELTFHSGKTPTE